MSRPRPQAELNYGFKGFDGGQRPKVVVLHTVEGEGSGLAAFRGMFDDLVHRKLCVHAATGSTGKIAYMMAANRKGRGAPPNTGKIHIEQFGRASYTKEKWHTREGQLHATAKLVAWYSYRWGIPIKLSTELGVCQHKDLPQGGHHDCGPGYPFAYVLDLAKVYRKHHWPGTYR